MNVALSDMCINLSVDFSTIKNEVKTLKDLMKTDVYSIINTATILDCLKFFIEKNISGCPIVDKNGKMVGILTRSDITKYAIEYSIKTSLLTP